MIAINKGQHMVPNGGLIPPGGLHCNFAWHGGAKATLGDNVMARCICGVFCMGCCQGFGMGYARMNCERGGS